MSKNKHILTQRMIDSLKPANKRYVYKTYHNLVLIVYPCGKKSYAVEIKINNKIYRRTFADAKLVKYKDALELAIVEKTNFIEEKKVILNYTSNIRNKLDRFLQIHRQNTAYTTYESTEVILEDFVEKLPKEIIYPEELTMKDIMKYIEQNKHLKSTTIKLKLVKIKQFIKYCSVTSDSNNCSMLYNKIQINSIIPKPKTEHHKAILDPDELKRVYRQASHLNNKIISSAIRILMLTALRKTNLINLKWSEIDFKNNIIKIKAENMKNNKIFELPISKQAKQILLDLYDTTGKYEYVFVSKKKQITRAKIVKGLICIGAKTTLHGFRSSFSTNANRFLKEHGCSVVAIELSLSHLHINDKVMMSYNHYNYKKEMAYLMQWYADFLSKH